MRSGESNLELQKLYSNRFNGDSELNKKNLTWNIICKYFLQKYISYESRVLDIAAGYCEFINNIQASEKYAIDLNPDISKFADKSITIFQDDIFSNNLKIPENYFDVIFVSNFLEHMPSKDDVKQVILIAKKLLRENGRIIILQPNIRYTKEKYWDFFDHKIPLTEKSIIELASILDLTVSKSIKRTLPYTQKSRIPQKPFLIKMYCKFMPISSKILGAQSLVILEKKC